MEGLIKYPKIEPEDNQFQFLSSQVILIIFSLMLNICLVALKTKEKELESL